MEKKFNMAVVMKSNTYENSAPIFLVSDREFQLRGKCSSEAASLFKAKIMVGLKLENLVF